MKKLVLYAVTICMLSIGLLYSRQYIDSSNAGDKNTLVMFNWGEYIDPDLVKKFEQETGISVIIETFDSNEAMLTKLKSGGSTYDLVVPSDYTIKKMKDLDLLKKIDKSKIPNFSNLNPAMLNKSFDKNNDYSIPYFWGTLGIVYNKKMVPSDITFDNWDDLWDERLKNNVMLVDGAREMLGISLQSQGYSVNETDPIKLKLAERKLELMGGNVKAVNNDEQMMLMVNEEAAVSVTFSGNASVMVEDNEDLEYVIPSEGSNIWFDNMVIPKNARNEEAAYKFINFMLDAENAAQNAAFIGYATPVLAALPILGEDITSDEQFYPKEDTFNNLEIYETQSQKTIGLQNDLFLEFKININRK